MASSLVEADAPSQRAQGTTPCRVDLASLPGVDISARYHAERCSGDFFDGQTVGSRLIFLLTDIAGPRAEAHTIATEVQYAFRQSAWSLFDAPQINESDAVAGLAHEVNRALMDAANGVRFAPTFLACFNAELGILTYCNAGRVLALFRDKHSTQPLSRGGVPLGLFTHVTYEPAVLAFEPGDKLLLASKGVTGSRRGAAEFGSRRIERILTHSQGFSAAKLCDTVLRDAYHFGNHPWTRVYDFLRPRKQSSPIDLTAVALIRL
jgi:serine phosphatase RsbU (regulator of sigma subunit)